MSLPHYYNIGTTKQNWDEPSPSYEDIIDTYKVFGMNLNMRLNRSEWMFLCNMSVEKIKETITYFSKVDHYINHANTWILNDVILQRRKEKILKLKDRINGNNR